MDPINTNQALIEQLKRFASHKMTEAEIIAQRKSWVRGMTTPCEHGVLDFETCPQCRWQDRTVPR